MLFNSNEFFQFITSGFLNYLSISLTNIVGFQQTHS